MDLRETNVLMLNAPSVYNGLLFSYVTDYVNLCWRDSINSRRCVHVKWCWCDFCPGVKLLTYGVTLLTYLVLASVSWSHSIILWCCDYVNLCRGVCVNLGVSLFIYAVVIGQTVHPGLRSQCVRVHPRHQKRSIGLHVTWHVSGCENKMAALFLFAVMNAISKDSLSITCALMTLLIFYFFIESFFVC